MQRYFKNIAKALKSTTHSFNDYYSSILKLKVLDYFSRCFISCKKYRLIAHVPWPVHFTSRILYYKNIQIGNRSAPGMNAGCYVQARNGIIIGHNFRMGPNSGLISSNHFINNYDENTKDQPIMIGNNVWLGMNVVVVPGAKIGNNVAVGANSVVTHNLPSDVIAAGSPCKIIRKKEPYYGADYAAIE